SCDVAAERGAPASGRDGRGVEDEQERSDGGREVVAVAGERESGAAGQEPAEAGDERLGRALDDEHPGAEADQGGDLVADGGADAAPGAGPERRAAERRVPLLELCAQVRRQPIAERRRSGAGVRAAPRGRVV